VEKSFKLISERWVVPICLGIWAAASCESPSQSQLPGAVGQQAVTDAAAQQERDRQARMATQLRPEEQKSVEAYWAPSS